MRDEENIYPDFGDEIPPDAIDDAQLSARLENELKEWRLIESPLPENPFKVRRELYKKYCFESFNKVVDYLNDLKEICDILPHHPRIENVWATLEVYLSTWAKSYDITYKDIQLARNMDRLYYQKYEVASHNEVRKIEENIDFLSEVKLLVSKDEIELAIDKLNKFFTINAGVNAPDDFVLLEARHSGYLTKIRRGTLSADELTREVNNIREGLLMLVDDMANKFA